MHRANNNITLHSRSQHQIVYIYQLIGRRYEGGNRPKVFAASADLGEKAAAEIGAIVETKLMEIRLKERIDGGIIKLSTIDFEALKVRVWRQQRPQQID